MELSFRPWKLADCGSLLACMGTFELPLRKKGVACPVDWLSEVDPPVLDWALGTVRVEDDDALAVLVVAFDAAA